LSDYAGNLYVSVPALSMARRDGGITKINAAGQTSSAATGLISPSGLAINRAAPSTIYVTEAFEPRVYRLASDGTRTAVAGTGFPGFSGDGGPAITAMLNNPQGLLIDQTTGALYIADAGN